MRGTPPDRNRDSEPGPGDFFALRTPLLPFAELLAWSEGLEAAVVQDPARLEEALAADRVRLRSRLRELLERPVIRDALFVASPDLDDSLEIWIRDPEGERGERIERGIVRYFSRMASRATPFGLFAGASVGAIGDRTRLVIAGHEKYERHSRLDMDFLFALVDGVARDATLRKGLALRPNSSLYRTAGRVHYVEARIDKDSRTYHLVAAEDTDELQATLLRAANGSDAESLAVPLAGGDSDVSRSDADEFITELVDSQILHPDIGIFVTGRDPTDGLAAELRGSPEAAAIGDRLEEARTALASIDAAGLGAAPASYRAIARGLEGLPAPVKLSTLFQVNMVKSSPEATLGGAVLEEIVRGIGILRRIAPPRTADDLSRFRDAFVARYEEREVPVVEALDEEVGIGFPVGASMDNGAGPLLKGLDLGVPSEETVPWGARERFLLSALTRTIALGSTELAIREKDLEALESKDQAPLPAAFAVFANLAAPSEDALARGAFRVLLNGLEGPSGVRPLGRFCDNDPTLHRSVERHLRAEEELDPEAVFAEIVHLPQGRLGNILHRPVLRDFEISYLGRSGAPAERQLPVTDLLLSASGGKMVLRSARLNRRVVPRLTSAHNFRMPGLGFYRFLCELQAQGTAATSRWNWGPLSSAPFLPRVACGRLVLSLATWNASQEELARLGKGRGAERFATVQLWRSERRLPRLVLLSDGDHQMPVDLDNVLSVESFVHLVKDRDEARLVEVFPGPTELCAQGPEGRFVHELIVPFVKTMRAAVEPPRSPSYAAVAPAARRTFPPGSEWLYAKLYSGASASDHLLRDVVAPLVEKSLASGAADQWFFIRYADPDHHLRLRFHGVPARLLNEVLPALHAAADPLLSDGRIRKLQVDTYERELERYGGPDGIELAERVFQVDSEAVLEILEMLEPGDEGADERWRLALLGIDRLLEDLDLGLEEKIQVIGNARDALAREFHVDGDSKRQMGERYRTENDRLRKQLESPDEESGLAPGLEVLRRRSERLAPLFSRLKGGAGPSAEMTSLSKPVSSLASSYVHMHVNRLLRSAHRAQELVLYDFLGRLYRARTGRDRAARGEASEPLTPTET